MQTDDNNSALRNLSALVDFSNLVNSSHDLHFILNNILLTCFGKLHTTKGLIALINDNGILEVKVFKGISSKIKDTFPEIKFHNYRNNETLTKFVNDNKFLLCQEIVSYDAPRGIIFLGGKLSKKPYDKEDEQFLKTILNIGATAIENSLTVKEIQEVNRDLDGKVNQLSSLFDLSKEFSGILEINMVSKMLSFSIIGQLLVSKYAVVTCDHNSFSILDSKYPKENLLKFLNEYCAKDFAEPYTVEIIKEKFKPVADLEVELIIPMIIKGETKGLILLGKRRNGRPYTRSDIEYVSSVGSLAIISIENARLFKDALEKQRLEKDLEIGRNIQKSLLPDKIPELKNFEIAAYNEPARRVGGDYYDLVMLDKENLLFAIADVSGKGVQAALLMANLQAFLKSICKQNLPLDSASNLINDLVSDNTTMGSFITFFWGIINDESKEMIYVNAGHNPPLLVRKGKLTKLKLGGMILGVMQTIEPYRSESIKLMSGDTLVLFTDGITEAMNINGEEYSDEKLEELIISIADNNADEILEQLTESVSEFTKGAEQSDDITCLIIKVK